MMYLHLKTLEMCLQDSQLEVSIVYTTPVMNLLTKKHDIFLCIVSLSDSIYV